MWLWVLAILYFCWLGYILCLAAVLINSGRPAAKGVVYVLMGNQAEVAEWFLRSMYRGEGILSGRLAVAVAAEGYDDTAGIVEIMSREREFSVIKPEEFRGAGESGPPGSWLFDVRGLNTRESLEGPLNRLKTL